MTDIHHAIHAIKQAFLFQNMNYPLALSNCRFVCENLFAIFQVKTEEITQPVSPTINANNNNAVDSDPSSTQSALPADKYESTVEKPSQETTPEQVKLILHSINDNQQLKRAKTTTGSLGCSLCALKTVTYIFFISLHFLFLLFS